MSLYLKYRPQDFKDLVGQGFIKETLQKAISEDKTVGAYLFTWPRGTGKTSTARIFAKAINCEKHIEGNPCWTCDTCVDFSENKLVDIIEIDAASHTGVDNIREIIEKAQFQPTKTRYKIYIIDEVHMLSKWAFNALLKILEEPPVHVKFILATTEIHKVPETILSRCQRYDFRNHTPQDTKERLRYIAKQENVSIDENSLEYITKASNGWLRNAISLFEQMIVDGKIEYSYIEETLGISKQEEIEVFAQKLIEKDIWLIKTFESLASSGKNLKIFFHEVLLCLWEISKQQILKQQDVTNILTALDTLHDTYGKTKNSFDEVLTFRIGLMKVLTGYIPNTNVSSNTSTFSWNSQKEATSKQDTTFSSDVQETTHEQKESLFWDAQDVFSVEEPAFEEQKPSNSQGFDTESFIAEVKKLGAKWAVTMSLRGANIVLNDTLLTIACKTKVARTSLSTPEVWDILHSALTNMWQTNITFSIV